MADLALRENAFNSAKWTRILHQFYPFGEKFYTYVTPELRHFFLLLLLVILSHMGEATTLERRKQISFNLELKKTTSGYPVYLRITEDGRHKRYKSTVELKRKSDWDSKKQRIKPSEPLYEGWQQELDQLKEKALSIHRELEKDSVSSADKIIEELRRGSQSESFLELAEKKRDECKVTGSLSSMRKYDQVCRKFIAFMDSRHRDPYSVKLKELNYNFIADFDAFMQTLDNQQYMKHIVVDGKKTKPDSSTPGAPKLHPNYIAKILRYTSSVLYSAEKAKLLKPEDNPFRTYSIKRVTTDREELSLDEVKKIMELELNEGSREWHSRNFFLFAMYCAGIRIGDLLCLRWTNIVDDRLHYQMGKNHKIQDIPLLPPALDIINLYHDADTAADDYIFPYMKTGKNAALWKDVKTVKDFDKLDGAMKLKYKETVSAKESLVNNGLKIIRTKAGITKPLSTHIARHTFARLAKEVHTDNSLVQGLLKHSNISTTERYMGRFSSDAQDDALKKVFQPLAPEMMRKNELLAELGKLSEDELAEMLESYKQKQSKAK